MSGESRPKAEQVVAVARAFGESPLRALVAAGYLTEDEIASRDSAGPRLLRLGDFTELELAQEMLRRIEHGDGEVLDRPVDVDHPAWSHVSGDREYVVEQTDTPDAEGLEILKHAAKTSAVEVEEDIHQP